MLRTVRPRRPSWAVVLVVAGLSAGLGAAAAPLLGSGREVRVSGAPEIHLPMPPIGSSAPRHSAGMALGAAAEAPSPASAAERGSGLAPTAAAEAPPSAPGAERGSELAQRVAADGRQPLLAYARPFDRDDHRPRIALLVAGLGLHAEITEAALRLPGEISLQFSVYAPGLPAWLEGARRAGHEVLLDLPMEPEDYPGSDPGPQALLAGDPPDANLQRLNWVLARAAGYVGLAGAGARFAASAAAPRILDALAHRGLGLIELGRDDLAAAASAAGLPYASAAVVIDEDPSLASIDTALARLEADALRHGSALGAAQAYPLSLERLRLWAMTLADKGLVLAPVSALVIERAGLAPGFGADDQAGRQPQG